MSYHDTTGPCWSPRTRTIRKWRPGDGLICSSSNKAKNSDMRCGVPVAVIETCEDSGPGRGQRSMRRLVCALHLGGQFGINELTESGQVDHFSERFDPRTGNASQPATKPRSITIRRDDEGNETGRTVDDRDLNSMSDDEYDDMLAEEEREDWEEQLAAAERNVIECSGCQQDHDPAVITEMDTETLLCPLCLDNATGEAPEQPAPAEPAKPRRRPITDAFNSATYELQRSVEKVVRLTGDDRLKKNKDQISGANLSDLIRVRDAVIGVINTLEG